MAAGLMEQLNPKHPLLQLARKIPWDVFESEFARKQPAEVLEERAEDFALLHRGLSQKRGDKNKLYSLHEPHVYCMSTNRRRF